MDRGPGPIFPSPAGEDGRRPDRVRAAASTQVAMSVRTFVESNQLSGCFVSANSDRGGERASLAAAGDITFILREKAAPPGVAKARPSTGHSAVFRRHASAEARRRKSRPPTTLAPPRTPGLRFRPGPDERGRRRRSGRLRRRYPLLVSDRRANPHCPEACPPRG